MCKFISDNNHRPPHFTPTNISALKSVTDLIKDKSFIHSEKGKLLYSLFIAKPQGLLSNFENETSFKYMTEICKLIWIENKSVSYSTDIDSRKQPFFNEDNDESWTISTAWAVVKRLTDSKAGTKWSISPSLTLYVKLSIDCLGTSELTDLHDFLYNDGEALEDGSFSFRMSFSEDNQGFVKFLDLRSVLLAIMLPLKVPSGVTFLELICLKGADFFNYVYESLSETLRKLDISSPPTKKEYKSLPKSSEREPNKVLKELEKIFSSASKSFHSEMQNESDEKKEIETLKEQICKFGEQPEEMKDPSLEPFINMIQEIGEKRLKQLVKNKNSCFDKKDIDFGRLHGEKYYLLEKLLELFLPHIKKGKDMKYLQLNWKNKPRIDSYIYWILNSGLCVPTKIYLFTIENIERCRKSCKTKIPKEKKKFDKLINDYFDFGHGRTKDEEANPAFFNRVKEICTNNHAENKTKGQNTFT